MLYMRCCANRESQGKEKSTKLNSKKKSGIKGVLTEEV